jgi:polyferredoxin
MDRVGRPEGLIAYDTFRNLDASTHEERVPVRLIRPRTLIYLALMLLVVGIMTTAWLNRAVLEVNVLHDRNPIFVQLSDGSLRNGYMVKLLNKEHDTRHLRVQLSDIEGARMQIVGIPGDEPTIGIEPDNVRALKVLVTVPADQRDKLTGSSTPFRFAIVDAADGSILYHDATFRGPEHE